MSRGVHVAALHHYYFYQKSHTQSTTVTIRSNQSLSRFRHLGLACNPSLRTMKHFDRIVSSVLHRGRQVKVGPLRFRAVHRSPRRRAATRPQWYCPAAQCCASPPPPPLPLVPPQDPPEERGLYVFKKGHSHGRKDMKELVRAGGTGGSGADGAGGGGGNTAGGGRLGRLLARLLSSTTLPAAAGRQGGQSLRDGAPGPQRPP